MMASMGTASEGRRVDEASRRERELSALFDEHYGRLRGLAFVMLGDKHAAEEVVMDAFAKAFSSWGLFRRVESPAPYLRKIVVNMCRGRIRRRSIEHRVNALAHRRGELRPPDWDPARSERRLDVWAAVRSLPERQRACVVLRYLEDMTESEIADALGCAVGTVKSQMFRARQTLAGLLDVGGDAS